MRLPVLPEDLSSDRDVLHRVAVHVLARRRAAATGRFGLRVTPAGFGAPGVGADEALRLHRGTLLREQRIDGQARTTTMAVDGTTLAELAVFAGADLSEPLSVGRDTPPMGDPHAPLQLTPFGTNAIMTWFALAAEVLGDIVIAAGPHAEPSVVQLWPEHFDIAVDLQAGATRVNLGASPGDASLAEPYAYVGPWAPERPGDPHYWNAPFGAVRGYRDLFHAADSASRLTAFFAEGLTALQRGPTPAEDAPARRPPFSATGR